jgi:hypothetical protein
MTLNVEQSALTRAKKHRPRWRRISDGIFLIFFALPVAASAARYAFEDSPASFRTANWSSTNLLPPAESDPQARVLVFSARNGRWRSIFAVHTWIVIKPENGPYTRYEVTGFGAPLRVNSFAPDSFWFSYRPEIIGDLRGARAAEAIPKIQAAIRDYPYGGYGDYRIWPGPNSNTFIATVLRAVPEFHVAMPPTAIGKNFRADGSIAGWTATRTGFEIEIFGLLGVKIGWVEGLEFNLFTLTAGVDVRRPALKLPGIGRIDADTVATAAAALVR